ncbi:unknown [Brachyspira sp. CAG:484]|nr:unknown [Brachyspira sp. CAG:484]
MPDNRFLNPFYPSKNIKNGSGQIRTDNQRIMSKLSGYNFKVLYGTIVIKTGDYDFLDNTIALEIGMPP